MQHVYESLKAKSVMLLTTFLLLGQSVFLFFWTNIFHVRTLQFSYSSHYLKKRHDQPSHAVYDIKERK